VKTFKDFLEGYKGTADLSKADPAAKKKVEDRIAKHFGTKRVPGGKKGVKEDYYSGTGEKVQARTKKFMDKKGQKGAPGLDAMKARTAEHKAKRGVKEEVVSELNRYGKETGKATGSLNKRPGSPVKKGGSSSPVMRAVRSSIRRETGRPEGQQKKVRGGKSSNETTPVDRIKRNLADKRAAQKDPSQGRYPKG